MDEKELRREYFKWLCSIVKCYNHRKLLSLLFSIDFNYIIPMDGNRYEDGINLRYRFADDESYHYRHIAALLDNVPCSMLEMMVALCLRIEEHITSDPENGDQTRRWFVDMLKNCGLWSMTDNVFSERAATQVILKVINRNYARNGDGGLFRLRRCRRDLRNVEIWYQAMWYLDEVLDIK